MADFVISDITISNNRLVIGDTVTIGFTLKNTMGSGYTLKKLTLWLRAKASNNPAAARLTYEEPVSIANGKSKKFSYTVTIEEQLYLSLTALQTALNASTAVRALPLMIGGSGFYTASGSNTLYGITIDFDIPGAYIMRSRCNPVIALFDLERADDGRPNDEGIEVLTTMKLAMADTSERNNMALTLYYAPGGDGASTSNSSISLTGSISSLLSGVTDSTSLITRTFSNGSDWSFLLVFGDSYERNEARFTLARSFANVHLSGDSAGGVCFGGFCKPGEPKFETHYPIVPYAGIRAVEGGAYESTLAFDSTAPFVARPDNPLYPTLRAFGNIVELHAEIQPSKTIAGSTSYWPICTIPAAYLPEHEVVAVQQGSSQAVWMLRIFPANSTVKDGNGVSCAGKACFSRYRNSMSEYTNATTSTWLPVHATWVVQGSASGGEIVNAARLADSTGVLLDDASGYAMTVASTTGNTVQLAHTAAQVDEAIDRTTILYNLYTSGELQAEIANKVMEELPRYAGEVEDA